MSKYIFSGLLAGLVLAVIFVVYMLLRGKVLVTFFKEIDKNIARMSNRLLFAVTLGGFILMALVFGAMAGIVYSLVGSTAIYLGLAIGLGIIFSLLAVISKTPLPADKIVWNMAVGLVLGLLIPFLSSV